METRATVRIQAADLLPGDTEAYGLRRTVERVTAFSNEVYVTWAEGGTSGFSPTEKVTCS